MYLTEEKRAQIRTCIENRRSSTQHHPADKPKSDRHFTPDNEDSRKVSQILFEARSGNEIFTPF